MKVKGFFKDITGANRIMQAREELITSGSPTPQPNDPIRNLADALHPGPKNYTVASVTQSSPSSKTYRFVPQDGHVPPFQSGQYANFYFQIGKSRLTRAYSISSAPYEARTDEPFFEVTIKNGPGMFVPSYLDENLKEGDTVRVDLPCGQFYYEPLRDTKNILALAGGSGITPFVSMAKEIAAGKLDINLTILYGSLNHKDICMKEDLDRVAECGKVHVVHVMSDDPEWEGEKGFITRELIEKYSLPDTTYFFCGPLPMFNFVKKSLDEMGVEARRFRHDASAQPRNVSLIPGFPVDNVEKTYKITVVRGVQEDVIPASGGEPVAVALERAGIPIDTHCRAGECGFCRAQLRAGDIFVSPLGDGRRMMDKEMGWFHSCSAYPLSDLTIKIPIL
ncbi:MAG: iron-sulfur cluster-binding domain-containing protein [Oscillospiraceae bacterium]|nr:iron-sulfur cluster-binding domain-containing protein [Oscillospiraceae bacterium]